MARPKKVAEEKPKEGATLQIDVDSFVRTRDSVSLIPILHSSSSLIQLIHELGAYGNVVFAAEHDPSPSFHLLPPHLNNHLFYTLGRLDSCIPIPPRPYPERLVVAIAKLISLPRTRSIVYIGTLASPMEL
jgi:hypothetical protein